MVVLQLVRRNPRLRQYYERLRAAGKPDKVAVIAAMRKLLTAVWSVATHRRLFVPIMPVAPLLLPVIHKGLMTFFCLISKSDTED